MTLVLFIYAIAYATVAGALMFRAPPSSRKKRRTRRNRVEDANTTQNPNTAIVNCLRSPDSGFSHEFLDSEWTHSVPGNPITWQARIVDAVTAWIAIKTESPPDDITEHKLLKKKRFSKIERAYKEGMAALIIYKCVFGPTAVMDFDTNIGGLLSSLHDEPGYNEVIVPFINLLCNKYNHLMSTGWCLDFEQVKDQNLGNWYKNLMHRASLGAWSTDCVRDSLRAADISDNPSNSDDCMVAGLYYPWYCTLCQYLKDFYKDAKKKAATHKITDVENDPQTWDAVLTVVVFE